MELSLAPIRTMEPAIVARLRLAFTEDKFTIERVPSVLTLQEFERVVRSTPFLGLAWTGMAPGKDNGRQLQADWTWRLTLIVRASGELRRRFSGDAYEIGLDAMVDVAMALLQGAELADIGTIAVTRAEAVYAEGWADDATVVAQVDFAVSTVSALSSLRLKTPEDFERLGIRWTAGEADPPIVAGDSHTVDPNGGT